MVELEMYPVWIGGRTVSFFPAPAGATFLFLAHCLYSSLHPATPEHVKSVTMGAEGALPTPYFCWGPLRPQSHVHRKVDGWSVVQSFLFIHNFCHECINLEIFFTCF
jgi:hypothetical protein